MVMRVVIGNSSEAVGYRLSAVGYRENALLAVGQGLWLVTVE
jgi:hypothetical protein